MSEIKNRMNSANAVKTHAAWSDEPSLRFRWKGEVDIKLEADLNAVRIDDQSGKIFSRLGVAHDDGVALRAVLHRDRFDRNGQRTLDCGNLNELAFFD